MPLDVDLAHLGSDTSLVEVVTLEHAYVHPVAKLDNCVEEAERVGHSGQPPIFVEVLADALGHRINSVDRSIEKTCTDDCVGNRALVEEIDSQIVKVELVLV